MQGDLLAEYTGAGLFVFYAGGCCIMLALGKRRAAYWPSTQVQGVGPVASQILAQLLVESACGLHTWLAAMHAADTCCVLSCLA